MEEKYFLHRIRKDGENYNSGIEIHDSLDSAIASFHGQMKMAYDNPDFPNMKFVSCMVTNGNDQIVPGYAETWRKEDVEEFFMHYIRHNGDAYTKGIDVCQDIETAKRSFHAQMEYGHDNSKFPDMSFVASMITGGSGAVEKTESWTKQEAPVEAD